MSISVTQTATQPKLEFTVEVHEGRGSSRHTVTCDPALCARLAGTTGASPEQLIHAVFEFLLERESKESIMSRFDVTVVSRYFPELESEIAGYLKP